MNINQLLFIVFIFISVQSIVGQDAKFKKVSKEILLKEHSSIESEATAEYLHRSCEVDFKYAQNDSRFEIVYSYFFRIKVYDDSDLSIVNRSIRYYIGGSGNKDEKIESIDGYTFNLVDGKVKKEKLDKDNIYTEEESRYWAKCNFAMPGVKKGSVIDLKYKVRSIYISNIDKFYFQQDHPVVYADFRAYIPEYFSYSNVSSGFLPLDVTTTTRGDKLRVKQKVKKNDASNFYSSPSKGQSNKDIEIDYITNIKGFSASNIPSLLEEPFVNNMNNYKSGIGFELISTQFPGATVKYYSENWNDIGKAYYDDSKFGGELKRDYKFDDFLNNIQDDPEIEKVKKIYAKVRDDFSWNTFYNDRAVDGIKKMIKTGTGNSAEMNLLLINLLQKSGVKCKPVLMRNRNSGALNVNYPTKSDLNYVIAQVDIGGKLMYLDATDKNLAAGELPRRAINRDGIILTEDGGSQILIENANKALTSTVQELSITNEKIVGTLERKYKKYSAYKLHSSYKSESDFISSLNKEGALNISEATVIGIENPVGAVNISGAVKYDSYLQSIDGKIFLDYALDIIPEVSPFKQEERQFAIFFDNVYSEINILKYNIPDGYIVEYVPENFSIALPRRLMMNVVEFQKTEDQVIVTIRESLKADMLTPEYYPAVKEFYEKYIDIGLEKIIFAKK